MPFVDLNTGRIYGCHKGSRSWWHEKGHLLFDRSESGTRVKYYHYFFTMVTIILLPFNLFIDNLGLKIFTLINGLGVLTTYLFEEAWCEWFAFKRMRQQ